MLFAVIPLTSIDSIDDGNVVRQYYFPWSSFDGIISRFVDHVTILLPRDATQSADMPQ